MMVENIATSYEWQFHSDEGGFVADNSAMNMDIGSFLSVLDEELPDNASQIGMSNENVDDVQHISTHTTASLSRMFEERDNNRQPFCDERRKVQHCAQEHVKRVSDEQEMLDFSLEKLRKKHDSWCNELSIKEALLEQEKQNLDKEKRKSDMQSTSIGQKKVVENALRLVEELKLIKKVIELEGQLNDKQKLEMEIVELKAKLHVVNDKLEAKMDGINDCEFEESLCLQREETALKKVRELERKLNGQQKLEMEFKKLEALLVQEKQKLHEEKRKNKSTYIEQRKAVDKALRLVEEQKKEKETALKKVLELEGQVNDKQKLEKEIVELNAKLQVVNDKLKEKMEEINDWEFEERLCLQREENALEKVRELEGKLNGKQKLEMEFKKLEALIEQGKRKLREEKRKNMEQIENTLKLVKEEKGEKEKALKEVCELRGQLNGKQKLEMEIKDLKAKLQMGKDALKEKIQGEMAALKNVVELKGQLNRKQKLEKEVKKLKAELLFLNDELQEKIEEMDGLEDLNQILIIKERQNNDELQETRKELIKVVQDMSIERAAIRIKRMGELDMKPFHDACKEKYTNSVDSQIKASELCSLWQEKLQDSHWLPVKVVQVNGLPKEVINADDELLKCLKAEWGSGVFYAVSVAYMEMNEYNPSGRYIVNELWSFKDNRRATSKEVVSYIVKNLKSHKRKRY